MTNRAKQNWPEDMTYDITTECAVEHDAVLATGYDCGLGGNHDSRAVEYVQAVMLTGRVFESNYEVQ